MNRVFTPRLLITIRTGMPISTADTSISITLVVISGPSCQRDDSNDVRRLFLEIGMIGFIEDDKGANSSCALRPDPG